MNLFTHFEPGFCVRLMTTLVHFFWQGTVVALLAVFAVALLRPTSSRVRYGVYVLALMLMAACPVVTFWAAGNRPTSGLPETAASVSSDAAPFQPAPHETNGIMPLRTSGPQAEAPEASRPVASSLRPRLVRTETRLTLDWKRYAPHAAGCYLVGMVVMLGRLLLALQGGKRLRRCAQPVGDPCLLALVAYWASELRLSFRPVIAYCRRVAVPTVVGVLRPTILFPLCVASGFSREQTEMLLLHELAHIRRHDHLVNVAQGLIEAFLFFHPAIWFVSRRIRIERENCCDEKRVEVTIRLEWETPLTLKFSDPKDEKPLENAHFLLFRSDGFPVGHGRTFSGDDGTFQFGGLRPGNYSLTAGKRAWQYGQTEYEISGGPMRIEVVRAIDNIVEVPLHPVELSQAEIEERWPFVVTGTVTDGEKQPMPGVEVRVHCGMGTLWQTGKAMSGPDGKYLLRFGPAMTSLDEESGQWVISWQFATVRAYKPGYYEKNLSRQGGLSIAGEARFIPENPREPVVLPNKPYLLDFVMLPAARIEARVVNHEGQPVADQRLWLSGKEMPPSQNVLAGADTDEHGLFTIGDVPCKSWAIANGRSRSRPR